MKQGIPAGFGAEEGHGLPAFKALHFLKRILLAASLRTGFEKTKAEVKGAVRRPPPTPW